MRGSLFRSVLALAFLLLAIFMALPVPKPFLWILDEFANAQVPTLVWPLLFAGGSISLFRARRPRSIRLALMGAFVLLGVVAGAAYLTQGLNSYSVMTLALMWGCMKLNLDIKDGYRSKGNG